MTCTTNTAILYSLHTHGKHVGSVVQARVDSWRKVQLILSVCAACKMALSMNICHAWYSYQMAVHIGLSMSIVRPAQYKFIAVSVQ